jgi:hypothetical protein
MVFGSLLLASTPTLASDAADPSGALARREEVVELVLAQDPRFAGLPDYERLRVEMAREFTVMPVAASPYYRVLPTMATEWSQVGFLTFRHPATWLIEVNLVDDCLEQEGEGILPIADPCGWRHAWYYRVEPDDTVTLLFDEGDPDKLANG